MDAKPTTSPSGLGGKLRIGCSGWGYQDWLGPFYPKDLPSRDFLPFYARVFEAVEIDSSYYRIPNPGMTRSWYASTPPGFVFTAKFPRRITHEKKLRDVEGPMHFLHDSLGQLQEKLGPLLIQLPPSFLYDKHRPVLTDFLELLPPRMRYAIEFRHDSWFREDVYALLRDRNIALTWAVNPYLTTPAQLTADFTYLRLVGEDRAITQFRGVQRDQSATMQQWHDELARQGDAFREGYVFFNNHFAGFGPASVNEFRRLAGLMEQDWSTLQVAGSRQTSLGDFA